MQTHGRYSGFRNGYYLLALAVLCAGVTCRSNAEEPAGDNELTAANYCGIHCLYTALLVLEHDVNPDDLVKPEYIGSNRGSSFAELSNAAENYGVHAIALEGLAPNDLLRIGAPAILHVKYSATSSDYDHFTVYLGAPDGLIQVLDPPNPLRQFTPEELQHVWDGRALLLSNRPLTEFGIMLRLFGKRSIGILTVVSLIWLLIAAGSRTSLASKTREWKSRRDPWLSGLAEAAALLLVSSSASPLLAIATSTIVATGVSSAPETGFAPARAAITLIELPELVELTETTQVFIVDARYPAQFNAAHIPGSVNVPVNLSDTHIGKLLESVPPDRPIVVYCEGPRCPYARVIATRLASLGYSRVSIFSGGWSEWDARIEMERDQ